MYCNHNQYILKSICFTIASEVHTFSVQQKYANWATSTDSFLPQRLEKTQRASTNDRCLVSQTSKKFPELEYYAHNPSHDIFMMFLTHQTHLNDRLCKNISETTGFSYAKHGLNGCLKLSQAYLNNKNMINGKRWLSNLCPRFSEQSVDRNNHSR